jgi:hypothetical protein
MKETLKKFAARFGDKPIKLLSGTEIKGWLASEPLALKAERSTQRQLREPQSPDQ